MNRTIFSPSFGNRPSFLVGREGVLDILQQGLSSEPGSRERSVVMLGQRGAAHLQKECAAHRRCPGVLRERLS